MSDIELDVGATTQALQTVLAETQSQHHTHDAAQPAFNPSAAGQINAARGAALAGMLSALHTEIQKRFIGLEQHTQLAQRTVAELAAGDDAFAAGVGKVATEGGGV